MISNSKLMLANTATNMLYNLNQKDKQIAHMLKFLDEKELDPSLTADDLLKIKALKVDCAKLSEITAEGRQHLKDILNRSEQGEVFSVAEVMQDFLPYF